MNKKEIIDLMLTATDIVDWNQKRELVKNSMLAKDWQRKCHIIDCEGFCYKILNKKL